VRGVMSPPALDDRSSLDECLTAHLRAEMIDVALTGAEPQSAQPQPGPCGGEGESALKVVSATSQCRVSRVAGGRTHTEEGLS
jgi:hypothetical protein